MDESESFYIQQVTVTNHVLSTSEKFKIGLEEEQSEHFEQGYTEGYSVVFRLLLRYLDMILTTFN